MCCKRLVSPLCRFYHGYDNYMQNAFPHDELKPLSKSYTDSLGAPLVLCLCIRPWFMWMSEIMPDDEVYMLVHTVIMKCACQNGSLESEVRLFQFAMPCR